MMDDSIPKSVQEAIREIAESNSMNSAPSPTIIDVTPSKLEKPKKSGSDNSVFVGSKPLINYVRSVGIQFTKNKSQEVIIKSRGKFIPKAVDIAEITRRKYLADQNIKIKDIKVNTEQFEKDGKTTNISTMDITLSR